MGALLLLSRWIDKINLFVGRWISWTVLAVVVVSAFNALGRKFLHSGSNAWLELQWYLFGALFLLSSGYTLLKNGHVRVDVLSSRLSRRQQIGIEIAGTLLFLMPAAVLIMVLAWPMFWESWLTQEASPNAGGLIRWPAKLLVPVGFMLLIAAGLSHLIKCVGFLMGRCPDPTARESVKTEEEKLAEELKARLDAEAAAAAKER
ncbi:MAG TPA: TRAP transporter small permease subunit [Pseudorhodoferax sp.]|jgi:TRAP-type mannitol/chloroaromatic compound transport system permease small subunit|nr:TRAP transporter small permease subunit [Pseudorhodoferax sp.]